MEVKLTDAEMIIMNILWEQGKLKAGEIAETLLKDKGWKRNTTYTLIKRLVKKDAIERVEPNYICKPLLKQENVRIEETKSLVDKMYKGSFSLLIQNFVKKENLSKEEIDEIRKIIDEVK